MRLFPLVAAIALLSAPAVLAQTAPAQTAPADADKQALGQEVMNQLQTILQLRAQVFVLQSQVASLQAAAAVPPAKTAETPATAKAP
jgi:hypothetical protein